MLWIVGFRATISKMPTVEDTKFPYFIADLAVFYISILNRLLTILYSKRNKKSISGALKYFSQTVTNILMSSAENAKI